MGNKPMGGMGNNMGGMNSMGMGGMGMGSMGNKGSSTMAFGGMGGGNKSAMSDPLSSLSMTMGGMNMTPNTMPAQKTASSGGITTVSTNQDLFSDFKIQ